MGRLQALASHTDLGAVLDHSHSHKVHNMADARHFMGDLLDEELGRRIALLHDHHEDSKGENCFHIFLLVMVPLTSGARSVAMRLVTTGDGDPVSLHSLAITNTCIGSFLAFSTLTLLFGISELKLFFNRKYVGLSPGGLFGGASSSLKNMAARQIDATTMTTVIQTAILISIGLQWLTTRALPSRSQSVCIIATITIVMAYVFNSDAQQDDAAAETVTTSQLILGIVYSLLSAFIGVLSTLGLELFGKHNVAAGDHPNHNAELVRCFFAAELWRTAGSIIFIFAEDWEFLTLYGPFGGWTPMVASGPIVFALTEDLLWTFVPVLTDTVQMNLWSALEVLMTYILEVAFGAADLSMASVCSLINLVCCVLGYNLISMEIMDAHLKAAEKFIEKMQNPGAAGAKQEPDGFDHSSHVFQVAERMAKCESEKKCAGGASAVVPGEPTTVIIK